MARRRKVEGLNPFVAAGLIKFSEEGEIEKIKLSPKMTIALSITFITHVLILSLLF